MVEEYMLKTGLPVMVVFNDNKEVVYNSLGHHRIAVMTYAKKSSEYIGFDKNHVEVFRESIEETTK